MYLEAVFTSPDIKKSLPVEGEEFARVDTEWKENIMAKATSIPKVINFTKNQKILEVLCECELRLETV